MPIHTLPKTIRDEAHLEQLLTEPTATLVDSMSRITGPIIILGVGGKMGPSLARMLRRADEQADITRQVIAVSRFSQTGLEQELRDVGVETIRGDLLDERFVTGLPDAENVIFMTGMKFGSSQDASMTWAMNVFLPSLVCRRFAGRRILAFSTGNVYPLVPVDSGGCRETDRPEPVGEYGMSALGRERMFEYFCRRDRNATSIVRLNYAVEMRYGVLLDLAQSVLHDQPIDLSMGYANVIWQGDANAMALASLADAAVPAHVINVAGPEIVSVRETCEQFAKLFDKQVQFLNQEAPTALLSDAAVAYQKYGQPRVSLAQLVPWTADWLGRGGATLSKPTHFQARDGRF